MWHLLPRKSQSTYRRYPFPYFAPKTCKTSSIKVDSIKLAPLTGWGSACLWPTNNVIFFLYASSALCVRVYLWVSLCVSPCQPQPQTPPVCWGEDHGHASQQVVVGGCYALLLHPHTISKSFVFFFFCVRPAPWAVFTATDQADTAGVPPGEEKIDFPPKFKFVWARQKVTYFDWSMSEDGTDLLQVVFYGELRFVFFLLLVLCWTRFS